MVDKKTWFKVKTTDYYQRFEEAVIENKNTTLSIRTGMSIWVRWPSKVASRHTLLIKKGRAQEQIDMNNHPDHFDTQKLFVQIPVYVEVDGKAVSADKEINVPLLGLDIAPVLR